MFLDSCECCDVATQISAVKKELDEARVRCVERPVAKGTPMRSPGRSNAALAHGQPCRVEPLPKFAAKDNGVGNPYTVTG